MRTPILVRWPGRISHGRVDVPVSSVDIPATILAASGVEVPERWPSVALRADPVEERPLDDAERAAALEAAIDRWWPAGAAASNAR